MYHCSFHGKEFSSRFVCYTAVLRKVVGQNRTRQCRTALWVMAVHGPRLRLQVFQRQRGNQHNKCIYAFSFLVGKNHEPQSINQSQTLSTHNANRHCHVRFYAFLRPLSKQLYNVPYTACHVVKLLLCRIYIQGVVTQSPGLKAHGKCLTS